MIHHIRRQILELDLNSEQGAETLQRRASRALQEKVLPELDRLFGQIAPEGRVVRLNKIEVDLGNLDDRNWEQRFVERCVQQVSQQVSEAAFSAAPPSDGGPLVLNARQNAWEVLAFFLQYGLLPWYAQGMSLTELEQKLSGADQGIEAPPFIKYLLFEKPAARQRLIRQFTPKLTEFVIEHVYHLSPGWIQDASRIRAGQTGQPISRSEYSLLIENLIAVLPTTTATLLPEPSLIARLFYPADAGRDKQFAQNQHIDSPNPHDATHKPAPEPGKEKQRPLAPPTGDQRESRLGNVIENEQKQSLEGRPDKTNKTPDNNLLTPAPAQDKQPESARINHKPNGDALVQPAGSKVRQDDENNKTRFLQKPSPVFAEGFWVGGAGLVLLAPYFPAFFSRLGISLTPESGTQSLETGVITDAVMLKALYVLHFLATGEENPEEHQLALPKILCGFPIEALIVSDNAIVSTEPGESEMTRAGFPFSDTDAPVLSETDITESLNLLSAVIQNWPVLKNTTPDGLQNGFLNRSGLLSWEENRLSWLLRVERQAFDILLDRLPWGYSVIKLPWMPQMLQVEW